MRTYTLHFQAISLLRSKARGPMSLFLRDIGAVEDRANETQSGNVWFTPWGGTPMLLDDSYYTIEPLTY